MHCWDGILQVQQHHHEKGNHLENPPNTRPLHPWDIDKLARPQHSSIEWWGMTVASTRIGMWNYWDIYFIQSWRIILTKLIYGLKLIQDWDSDIAQCQKVSFTWTPPRKIMKIPPSATRPHTVQPGLQWQHVATGRCLNSLCHWRSNTAMGSALFGSMTFQERSSMRGFSWFFHCRVLRLDGHIILELRAASWHWDTRLLPTESGT